MQKERWHQVREIFDTALKRPPEQRDAFLQEACEEDEYLRKEVASLLAQEGRAEGLFDSPALEVAAMAIAKDQEEEPPPDLTGRTLSHYRIVEKIGEGGMGVVYRAEDTRLKRSVAIKLLPSGRVSDPERKRHFVKEARTASALNHPNIVTIYDVEQADDIDFIAMEYVAGKSLRALISRHGMKISQALRIAIQMAEGLGRAHAAGIVHRDLKPSNIMVTSDGLVKILDFGLAKLTERQSPSGNDSASSLAPSSETEPGEIAGTAAYMSPEQAEGRPIDARSDIFSFGSVLYEMVTGRRAFQGDSSASILAALMKEDPKPPSQLAPHLPAGLERVLQRCLRKDTSRRWQHIDDVRVELEDLKEGVDSQALYAGTTVVRKSHWGAWAVVICLTLGVVLAGLWLMLWRNPAETPESLAVIPLTSYPGSESCASFSPDGSQIAFSWSGPDRGNEDIYIKLIGGVEGPLRLTENSKRETEPAWSPDNRWIAFLRQETERVCSVILESPLAGPERVLAEIGVWGGTVGSSRHIAWHPSGEWLVVADMRNLERSALFLLSVVSDERKQLTFPGKGLGDLHPDFTPNGRNLAFTRLAGEMTSDVYYISLTDVLAPAGEPKPLTSNHRSSQPTWISDGRELLFVQGSPYAPVIWRMAAFQADKPRRVPITNLCGQPDVSPERGRLVFTDPCNNADIWQAELDRPDGTAARLTNPISSTCMELAPQFSPDGNRIAFQSNRSGSLEIWVCGSDGSQPVQLTSLGCAELPNWSADGKRLVFTVVEDGAGHLYEIDAQGANQRRLTSGRWQDKWPSYSRDGKWVYFGSNRTGRYEVWKLPIGGGEAVQVTKHGGAKPIESADGTSVYYLKESPTRVVGPLWKTSVQGGDEREILKSIDTIKFSVSDQGIYFVAQPETVVGKVEFLSFATGEITGITTTPRQYGWAFSVSPDGRRILFARAGLDAGSNLMLVENFR